MRFNASIDVAIIISLVTVFLFANGQAYLGGYLGTFGIDPIVLNFSVQDKIYIGYLKGFNYLVLSVCLLAVYVIARYAFLIFEVQRKLNRYIDKKLDKIKSNNNKVYIHNSLFYEQLDNEYNRHSFLYVVLITLLLSTLLLLANTEKKAKFDAEEAIKEFSFRPIQVKESNSELYLIECGSNLCALIDKNKKVTLEYPKNVIFSVKEKD